MQTKLRNIMSSKKGFTLIELLVVIGILAVLAAIAIPSVAGLIDRANVSADKTNANEMTNAIERFTSEYELYIQDISSGALDFDKLDSAQGRVKNVIDTGATDETSRDDITALEIAQGGTVDHTKAQLYRDTQYPTNEKTLAEVVKNYTMTSSATFQPKQSDCHFFYSPKCGLVVVAEADSTIAQLNDLVISGMDAKGNALDDNDKKLWIDISDADTTKYVEKTA